MTARAADPLGVDDLSASRPQLETAADAVAALGGVAEAVAADELMPGQAAEFAKLVGTFAHSLQASEFEARITKLEEKANS